MIQNQLDNSADERMLTAEEASVGFAFVAGSRIQRHSGEPFPFNGTVELAGTWVLPAKVSLLQRWGQGEAAASRPAASH